MFLRVGGEQRWVAAEDAGLYRDALGAVPPSGLPEAFIADVPDAMERLVKRYARTHGPFESRALRDRYGLDFTPVLERLEQSRRRSCAASCAPAGRTREWCDPEVLRRLRRASLAALRAEIEPADQRALARFLANWQGIDRHPPAGAGIDRLREILVPLQGLRAAAGGVGARPAAAPHRRLLARVAGPAVRVGRGRVGRRGRARAALRPRGAVLPRRRAADRPAAEARRLARRAGARGDPRAPAGRRVLLLRPDRGHRRLPDRGAPERALGSRVGGRGDQRRVRAAALPEARGLDAAVVAARAGGTQAHVRLAAAQRRAAGRPGPLVARRRALFRAGDDDPVARRRTQAELLLERYGIVTREQVLAEGIPGGFSSLYDSLAALETIGVARRGYFVEGLGGAQFALPGAVERLRAQKDDDAAPPIVLAATDPAQPYGAVLKWPDTPRRPARAAGAYVVLAGAEPVLFVEKGGKGVQVLVPATTRAWSRRSPRWSTRSSAAGSSGSRWRRSTASPWWARRGRSCCSSSASAPARASSH